ncbi:MAG: phage tail protein I [Puniceicoccales bacterium]|jgi:phage tail P2-like protein|nr:phage tail protein I [Puniceicoccales bacterium]
MHLLPPNSTPQERALSLATARVLDVPVSPVRKLWSPWECPADVLPWLAWSLSVEPWNSGWPEQRKRAAIAAGIESHRIKGTVGAVRLALSTLGYDVEIDEQTGQAHTFRLLVDAEAKGLTGADYDTAEDAALIAKNARSHLLGVLSLIRREGRGVLRAVLADGEVSEIEAAYEGQKRFGGAVHVKAALTGHDVLTVRPGSFDGFAVSAEVVGTAVFTTVDHLSF